MYPEITSLFADNDKLLKCVKFIYVSRACIMHDAFITMEPCICQIPQLAVYHWLKSEDVTNSAVSSF